MAVHSLQAPDLQGATGKEGEVRMVLAHGEILGSCRDLEPWCCCAPRPAHIPVSYRAQNCFVLLASALPALPT